MSQATALEPAGPICPRRFNLVDSMILTAAVAIACMPPWPGYLLHIPTRLRAWGDWAGHIAGRQVVPDFVGVSVGPMLAKDVMNFATGLLSGPLLGLTPAVIWLRLRRPRPSPPALLGQPGFAACLAALAGFVTFLEANYFGANLGIEATVGGAVAAAWALLAVGGWWAPERSWIDRLGRAVGACWIAVALCEVVENSI